MKALSRITILSATLFFLGIVALANLMPLPAQARAQDVCTKDFYTPSDIIGYFRNERLDESYYLTYDGCVVKDLLWYGTIFAPYAVSESEIKKDLHNIFPERQVYFGLIPDGFVKYRGSKYYLAGKFTTKYHKEHQTGIFLNDNPFKNIFGGNYPRPPRYVPGRYFFSRPFEVSWPPGQISSLLKSRMEELHNIFKDYIVKGWCRVPNFSQRFPLTCNYFSVRTVQFTPHSYYSFNKLPEYNPKPK